MLAYFHCFDIVTNQGVYKLYKFQDSDPHAEWKQHTVRTECLLEQLLFVSTDSKNRRGVENYSERVSTEMALPPVHWGHGWQACQDQVPKEHGVGLF